MRKGKNSMHIEKKTVFQFLRFGIVGVVNTLVYLAVYYLFLHFDPGLYLIGNIIGWFVSVINAFFWNSRFVFSSKSKGAKGRMAEIIKTYIVYGSTFFVASVLLYVEVDILQWSSVLSPILNLMITIPSNYLLNKFWTFGEKVMVEDNKKELNA